jgi:hypothetical protein
MCEEQAKSEDQNKRVLQELQSLLKRNFPFTSEPPPMQKDAQQEKCPQAGSLRT